MSKKLLLGVIIVLLITNIASLLFWNKDETVVISTDEEGSEISREQPVAVIDGEEISYDEWMSVLRSNHGEKQLKTMIDGAVVKQLADERNIEIDEKVIERETAMLTAMQGVMSQEEFEQIAKNWRDDIIYRYQLEMLLTEGTSIPEDEVESYYNTYGNQYDYTSSMQLSHIIVQNFDVAEQIIEELEDGASFDLLAQEYSTDEESKNDGGYLGFIFTTSQFFPNGYEEVANNMEEHSYSEPFRADSGVAIVYLHRKLPAIKFTYEEMKPYIESELALRKLEQSLNANPLWDELHIEWLYDE
ncbi:peptidylprolyl isomerase [Virgibacillus sp. C22-A2]|uniref:peptidylprolyl isomerase n=1 Tax=Virgibacillus tibetensis TaxID=3042313 RepID=A0ABU6KL79_9BACI|nr:peptidylprolyl isomerase [Virgibacillus sp. C22-A2]